MSLSRLMLLLSISLVLLGCASFAQQSSRYSEHAEKIYLSSTTVPDLIIPTDLQATTQIYSAYPIPEGPRRTKEEGRFKPWPPQNLPIDDKQG